MVAPVRWVGCETPSRPATPRRWRSTPTHSRGPLAASSPVERSRRPRHWSRSAASVNWSEPRKLTPCWSGKSRTSVPPCPLWPRRLPMKILIAEDDPIVRRLLETYVQEWGHEVVLAKDGEEAWGFFQECKYSLVISDWMMPRVDGLELVRRIRASDCPGYVYVMLLTSKSSREDIIKGMEAGADDFMAKPFDR